MNLGVVGESERANIRRLAQIGLRKNDVGNSPAAGSALLLRAAFHLHALEVGSAQALTDAAEYMTDLAANTRACARRAVSEPPGAE